jgi:hypothetical protein
MQRLFVVRTRDVSVVENNDRVAILVLHVCGADGRIVAACSVWPELAAPPQCRQHHLQHGKSADTQRAKENKLITPRMCKPCVK